MASDWMLRQVRRVDGKVFVETRIERTGKISISQDMVVEGQEASDEIILNAWHQLPFNDEVWSGRYEINGIVFEF